MDMTLGSRDLECRQLNWTQVHRVVWSFLAERFAMTEIAILL